MIDSKAVRMFVMAEEKQNEDTDATSKVNNLSESLMAEILSPDPKLSRIEFTDPYVTPPLISEYEQSCIKVPNLNKDVSQMNQSYVQEQLFQPNMLPILRSGSYNSEQMYTYQPITVPIESRGFYNIQPFNLYHYGNHVSPYPVTSAQNFQISQLSLGTPNINYPRN